MQIKQHWTKYNSPKHSIVQALIQDWADAQAKKEEALLCSWFLASSSWNAKSREIAIEIERAIQGEELRKTAESTRRAAWWSAAAAIASAIAALAA